MLPSECGIWKQQERGDSPTNHTTRLGQRECKKSKQSETRRGWQTAKSKPNTRFFITKARWNEGNTSKKAPSTRVQMNTSTTCPRHSQLALRTSPPPPPSLPNTPTHASLLLSAMPCRMTTLPHCICQLGLVWQGAWPQQQEHSPRVAAVTQHTLSWSPPPQHQHHPLLLPSSSHHL